jgi:hypothetical protein
MGKLVQKRKILEQTPSIVGEIKSKNIEKKRSKKRNRSNSAKYT